MRAQGEAVGSYTPRTTRQGGTRRPIREATMLARTNTHRSCVLAK